MRDAFTDEDLATIFGGDYESFREETPERYWLPLLMLYTGARNEEVAQLHLKDVKKVDGEWCIDINQDTPDKSIKNKFSKRVTPLHPALIERGFIAYVERLRKEGHEAAADTWLRCDQVKFSAF